MLSLLKFNYIFTLLGALMLLSLAGCSSIQNTTYGAFGKIKVPDFGDDEDYEPPPKTQGMFKVGSPYQIFGKWYRPQEDYNLVETGIASWYGPQFHGNYTANGEIFDMYELTAAHRTLQIPSIARVTNLENGRSLVVRINDRGPFKRGRVIDVSKRSAELLGMIEKGTAKVRIEVLTEESKAVAIAAKRGEDTSGVEIAMNEPGFVPGAPQTLMQRVSAETQETDVIPVAPLEVESVELTSDVPGHISGGTFYPDPVVKQVAVAPSNIFVQAGSFGSKENAIALARRLGRKAGVYPANINGKQFFRVRIPTDDVNVADNILNELAASGNADAIIIVE